MTVFTPQEHGVGIVHLGPGAFHRAHQAVYTQDAMAAAGGDWRILGVSLRSTGVADALNAQAGRYTLVTKGPGGTEYRTIEAISGALAAAKGLGPVRQALARAETRIVSLTVTEKAYRISQNAGEGDVVPLIVAAFAARREAGLRPFTLLCCDNLPNNGDTLRRAVLAFAEKQDTGLADWIAKEGRFPSTMVDRITPSVTPELMAEVAAQTGWSDRIPVETEPFTQWVIEDSFANGRPAWDRAGAQLVSDVAPYEDMKLRMLNGAHSMLAYAGHMAGLAYVRDVMGDAGLAGLVARHMTAAAATLNPADGLDWKSYRKDLLDRFRNPHLAHETYQIAMDGSQKMPQRIFAPALEAVEKGLDVDPFAFATAAWALYLGGRTETGASYALRDPREAELSALPLSPETRVAALFALPDLVPPKLAAHDGFLSATQNNLADMTEHGMAAAIQKASS